MERVIKYMGIFVRMLVAFFALLVTRYVWRKAKEVQKEYIINLVIFSKMWLLFAVICTVCGIFFGFMKTASAETGIIVSMVFLVFAVLLYLLSILYCRFHIDIDDEKIEYCPPAGKSRCRYFDKITKAEIDEKDNLHLYSDGEKTLKIPLEIGREYVITLLKCNDVRVRYKYNIDDFEMRLPLFYPIFYIFCFIVAGMMAGLSAEVKLLRGVLLWSVMMACSAFEAASDYWGKVVVRRNEIAQVRFLRKTKRIAHKQIVRVARRSNGRAPQLLIYSEKGVAMKINMLCENRELLEELVRRRHWER